MSFGEKLLGQYLDRIICESDPLRQHRPAWLKGLELDFYFEGSQLAFEFQGVHHFVDHNQKRRDSVKRDICMTRGIVLIRVDAADLSYARLVRLLKYWFGFYKRNLSTVATFDRKRRDQCRALDLAAANYRRTLTTSFSCPTAHRKGSRIRGAAMRAKFHPAPAG